MKIIKTIDKKSGDKTYWRFILRIPSKIVETSGLIGKNLKVKAEKNKIIIEKD